MIKPVEYSADRNESGKLFGSNTLNNLTTSRQLNDEATAGNTEIVQHRSQKFYFWWEKKGQSYKTASKTLQFKHYPEIQVKKK